MDTELRDLLISAHAQAVDRLVDMAYLPPPIDRAARPCALTFGPTDINHEGRVREVTDYIRRIEARLGGAPGPIEPAWLRSVIDAGNMAGAVA